MHGEGDEDGDDDEAGSDGGAQGSPGWVQRAWMGSMGPSRILLFYLD